MINQIVLVGRLAEKPQLNETEDGTRYSKIILIVPRPYKNKDGIYENDFIECTLLQGIADRTCQWCNKGDLIGLKGVVSNTDNKKIFNNIIAEKITFLSSKKSDETLESEE